MTVIAYDDGILVSDSRLTIGPMISDDEGQKLYELEDGSCAAFCGWFERSYVIIDWLQNQLINPTKAPIPVPRDGEDIAQIIHLRTDGSVWQYDRYDWNPCHGKLQGWGFGGDIALAFMRMGHTPFEGVEAAGRVYGNCGGDFQYFALPYAQARLNQMLEHHRKEGLFQ